MAQTNYRNSYGQDGVAARGLVNGRDPHYMCGRGLPSPTVAVPTMAEAIFFEDKHLKCNL